LTKIIDKFLYQVEVTEHLWITMPDGCRRPDADLNVRTETRSSLTSTLTEFHFTAEMEVFEHEEKTYSKSWSKSFDRELN